MEDAGGGTDRILQVSMERNRVVKSNRVVNPWNRVVNSGNRAVNRSKVSGGCRWVAESIQLVKPGRWRAHGCRYWSLKGDEASGFSIGGHSYKATATRLQLQGYSYKATATRIQLQGYSYKGEWHVRLQ